MVGIDDVLIDAKDYAANVLLTESNDHPQLTTIRKQTHHQKTMAQ